MFSFQSCEEVNDELIVGRSAFLHTAVSNIIFTGMFHVKHSFFVALESVMNFIVK